MTTDARMEERERIARIIDPRPWKDPFSWPKEWEGNEDVQYAKNTALKKADAILSLRSTPPTTAAPSGREVVTAEMLNAGWQAANDGQAVNKSGFITDAACERIYKAMDAASPQRPEAVDRAGVVDNEKLIKEMLEFREHSLSKGDARATLTLSWERFDHVVAAIRSLSTQQDKSAPLVRKKE